MFFLFFFRNSVFFFFFFFSSRRRHTRLQGDWSSDVCSSDLVPSLAVTSHQYVVGLLPWRTRSEERRVGKSVDLGGRRIIKKKKKKKKTKSNKKSLTINQQTHLTYKLPTQ